MTTEQFLEFENKEKLFEDEIEGFHYWPYIRYEVYTWICADSVKNIHPQPYKKNKMDRIKDLFLIVNLAVFHNTFRCRRHVDVLAMGYPRWVKNSEGIFVDPYVEYLTGELGYSSQIIERYFAKYKNYNSESGSRVYTEDSEFIVKIRLHLLSTTKKQIIRNKCSEIHEKVLSEFNIDIKKQILMNKMAKSYVMWLVYRKKYRKLLSRTTPICILETPGYADSNQIMNEVAKEMAIPTIEIEHGWILENHVPYNYIFHGTLDSFPDDILVYSQYQPDNVRFPISLDHIHVVGSPFLEEQVKNICVPEKKDRVILFLGNIVRSGNAINKFAVEVAQYIRENDLDYKIIFKAHPKDLCDSEEYEMLRQYADIVEIISGTLGKSVYDCLAEASIAVGTSTSALFEAKAFGTTVFVLEASDSENMKNFVNQGYAKYISAPQDVFENSKETFQTDLWPTDSLRKSVAAVSQIIDSEKRKQNEKSNF